MSLESGHPNPAPHNSAASALTSSAAPTSQLLQQLQQPLDVKTPVNNPSSSVNKNISIPNPPPSKVEPPQQPSPTGNNNKSNINLNHISQAPPILTTNSMTTSMNAPHQLQQQLNAGLQHVGMNPSGNGMQPINVSTSSIMQQQLTNNNPNPLQVKHQNMRMEASMNTFVDPLEHSLASLEQPQMNNNSQKNPQDMNAMLIEIQRQQLLLSMAAPHIGSTNGFGSDFNGANGVNNLMNMLAMPQMDPSSLSFLNPQMKNVSGRFPPDTWNNLSNVNQMVPTSIQQQQHSMQQHPQMNHSVQHQQQPPPKQEKIMLTPKPIEELLMNPNDKAKSHGGQGQPPFGQAFNKYEQNLKNAQSWSQIAAAGSPQNPGTSIPSKSKVPSDTFQEYRTKAKEQQQRQKQEQEKMKKQKEQELKRQQESLQKQQKSNEDISNGHRFVLNRFILKTLI